MSKRHGIVPPSLDEKDPWGNPYRVVIENDRPVVVSNGPDGVAGTKDDIRSEG